MKKYVAIFSDGETHSSIGINSEKEFEEAMNREQVITIPGKVRWGALFEADGKLVSQIFLPENPLFKGKK